MFLGNRIPWDYWAEENDKIWEWTWADGGTIDLSDTKIAGSSWENFGERSNYNWEGYNDNITRVESDYPSRGGYCDWTHSQ